ncbi:MAG: hypothetical protein ACRYF0_13905 [Janthinobacterium lividum]
MKKMYRRLAVLGVAAASLSSCNRTAYPLNAQTPIGLGTTRVLSAPVATAPDEQTATVTAPAVALTPTVAAPTPPAATAPSGPAATASLPEAAPSTATTTGLPKAAKPTLAQRLVLNKVLKQVAKAELRQQNTASVAKTAGSKSAPLTVAIIGLAALIVGIIASSGLVIVLGAIVLVVGIVLLILNAL